MDKDQLTITALGLVRAGSPFLYDRIRRQAGAGPTEDDIRAAVQSAETLYRSACEAVDRIREDGSSETAAAAWLAEREPGHGPRVYEYVLWAARSDTR
jgi:hypothetical protein